MYKFLIYNGKPDIGKKKIQWIYKYSNTEYIVGIISDRWSQFATSETQIQVL